MFLWKQERAGRSGYHPVGEDMGCLEDPGNHDVRTEGMSYGMMMCVQLDMKEEFDRIWKQPGACTRWTGRLWI